MGSTEAILFTFVFSVLGMIWKILATKVDKKEFFEVISSVKQEREGYEKGISDNVAKHERIIERLYSDINEIKQDIAEIKVQLEFINGKGLIKKMERLETLIDEMRKNE